MQITCFLHSYGDSGEFLGIHEDQPLNDIFAFSRGSITNIDIQKLNQDIKDWLEECWIEVKDNTFIIDLCLDWDGSYLSVGSIEMLINIPCPY